ncbi:creatininase family protein [Paenibacillus thalictri]|uniref:Creatininase family protein n=1 Tax=Paenibacillus thalictri TaxID=2527873 RepID=A0A4V2J3A1_9BACL|nr:creatininase family protein [Paenibacillus thalictri]TBL70748.1 creatininase family protein [Paenibacillus thalictri]
MMGRYQGKAWDRHFLPRLSKKEVEAIPKDQAVVVLPVGAMEQHGPHLPVFTDTLIGESYMTYAFEYLPDDAPIWLLPPLPYGKSNEHLGHFGTVSLSATTLMSVLLDIARSLKISGFRKLVLTNTHGGNADLLNMMGREIRVETGLEVYRLDPGGLGQAQAFFDPEEIRTDIHGGAVETSLVLAAVKHWVHLDVASDEIPHFPASPYLDLKKKAFAWVIDDLSASGTSGNAKLASEEKGKGMLEAGGKLIAQGLMEIAGFDLRSIRQELEKAYK